MAPTQVNDTSASALIAKDSNLPDGYKSIIKALSRLKHNVRDSDLIIIKCGDAEWRAHHFILYPQSSYFQRAFDSNYKEAQTGVFDLDPAHLHAIPAMLDYMYEQTYEDTLAEPSIHPLVLNVMVYTLADYLGMPELEKLATEKFCKRVTYQWNTVGFSQAIRELYDNAPDKDRGMRKAAVGIASRHPKEYIADQSGWGQEFRKLLAEVNVFNLEYLIAVKDREDGHKEGDRAFTCGFRRKVLIGQRGHTCPSCYSQKLGDRDHQELFAPAVIF